MKVLVAPNFEKAYLHTTNNVIETLLKLGAEVLVNEKLKNSNIDLKVRYGEFFTLLNECDFLVAIGGDGTMIHYAKHVSQADKPLLGINLGRLGFLASAEKDELHKLQRLLDADCTIEKRMMLEVSIIKPKQTLTFTALNDVVVSKKQYNPIDIAVTSQNKSIADFQADGLIFSTPTGSTAYALSAGGPVIQPDMECIAMTPICAHTLFARTTVFSADRVIDLTVQTRAQSDDDEIGLVVIDGQQQVPIGKEDRVAIRKSNKIVKIVNVSDLQFYEIINHKFMNSQK